MRWSPRREAAIKKPLAVFGPGGEDIISSGDKVSDDAVRQHFVTSMTPNIRSR